MASATASVVICYSSSDRKRILALREKVAESRVLWPRAWEGGTQVAQEGAEMKATWRPSAVHAEGTLVTADSRHLALSVSLRLN